MCDSMTAQQGFGNDPAEWLAVNQDPSEDEKEIPRAGMPSLCPKWAEAALVAIEGNYTRTHSDGTYSMVAYPKKKDLSEEVGEIAPGNLPHVWGPVGLLLGTNNEGRGHHRQPVCNVRADEEAGEVRNATHLELTQNRRCRCRRVSCRWLDGSEVTVRPVGAQRFRMVLQRCLTGTEPVPVPLGLPGCPDPG